MDDLANLKHVLKSLKRRQQRNKKRRGGPKAGLSSWCGATTETEELENRNPEWGGYASNMGL